MRCDRSSSFPLTWRRNGSAHGGMRCSVRRIVAGGRNYPTGGSGALRHSSPSERSGAGSALWGHRAGLRGTGRGRWARGGWVAASLRRDLAGSCLRSLGKGGQRGPVQGWMEGCSLRRSCVLLPLKGSSRPLLVTKSGRRASSLNFPRLIHPAVRGCEVTGEASLLQSAAQICGHARDCQTFRTRFLLLFTGLSA